MITNDSPCVAQCSTALGDNVCRGCARTFREVAQWSTLSAPQRSVVCQQLPSRQLLLGLARELGVAFDILVLNNVEWGVLKYVGLAPVLVRKVRGQLYLQRNGDEWQLDYAVPTDIHVVVESINQRLSADFD